MRFTRQRSNIATDVVQDEPEARRRNRLSKPLTSKITTTVSTTNLQEPVSRTKNVSTVTLPARGPLSSHPSNAGLRQQIRSEVFDSDQDSPNKSSKTDSTWSVAYMVSQIDNNSVQEADSSPEQPPVSPLKPKKRKSLILRRLSSRRSTGLTRSASNGRLNSLEHDAASASTHSSSFDRIVDAPSIPPTRRASFTPGTATRKPSRVYSEQNISEEKMVEEQEPQNMVAEDYFDWQPPRPPTMAGRAGTPADLDYSHLGSFRHGSLQIVNGRASPTFSEMSKSSRQLLSIPKPQRTLSSNYGDVDDEVNPEFPPPDMPSLPDSPSIHTDQMDFDWGGNEQKPVRAHPLKNVMSPEADSDSDAEGGQEEASVIAQEYMAELPPSPFSGRKSSSLTGSIRRTRSEAVLRHSSSISSLEELVPPQDCLVTEPTPSFTRRSPSPPGSVVWRSRDGHDGDRGRGMSYTVFEGGSHNPTGNTMSWYSATASQLEEPQLAHGFPVQSAYARLQPPRAPEKSDSGYSSCNSLRSVQMTKTVSPTKKQALQNASASTLNIQPQQVDPELHQLRQRPPVLKSRKTEPQLSTVANLESAPVLPTTVIAAPSGDASPTKPSKLRKRLQKKRPSSQPPSKVSVSGTHSLDGESVPQVPTEARDNLRVRTQEVPELEQTYQSPHLLSNQPSISSIELQTVDIRFPSPAPEPTPTVKRSRSLSRPRSWIGRAKEERRDSKRDSGISQVDAMGIINAFGTVASSLGGSPYDVAHANVVSEQTMNPYNISTIAPRPRQMMDDKAATELSRLRSRATQERDGATANRRSSFNDRGGIPGRNLRPASFASDAPPITAEMLQKAYRTSSEQRQPSLSHVSAPPPPPHSPRPSYIEYDQASSPISVAPPPPSHSRRPVDVSSDPWAARAAAWRAGKYTGDPTDGYDYNDFFQNGSEEPLYPEIPPRQYQHRRSVGRRSYAEYIPSRRDKQENFEVYGQSGHAEDLRADYDNQQWNEPNSAYERQSWRNSMTQHYGQFQGSNEALRSRPLPAPGPAGSSSRPARPYSNASSIRSHASSLVEELYPSDLERPHPPPQFGRYSGGLSFDYVPGKGFGGSAGARSVSGVAEAPRREVPLRASFGIDLGDVPVLPTAASLGRGY